MSRPSDSKSGEADLAAAYSELQNLLLDRPDVTEFLEQLAVLAASIVDGSSCGITMRREHEVSTVATSDSFAIAVDEIQYGRGQGPCLETLHVGHRIYVSDLASETRWSNYRIYALAYGVRSSLSLPLSVDNELRGALNLYTKVPNSFDGEVAERCAAFARQGASALTLVVRSAAQTTIEEQLRDALATRGLVDQAVGIIMGQQRIGAGEAFSVLRETSQNRNRRVRDIAGDLIEAVTGKPPQLGRPFAEPRQQ